MRVYWDCKAELQRQTVSTFKVVPNWFCIFNTTVFFVLFFRWAVIEYRLNRTDDAFQELNKKSASLKRILSRIPDEISDRKTFLETIKWVSLNFFLSWHVSIDLMNVFLVEKSPVPLRNYWMPWMKWSASYRAHPANKRSNNVKKNLWNTRRSSAQRSKNTLKKDSKSFIRVWSIDHCQ